MKKTVIFLVFAFCCCVINAQDEKTIKPKNLLKDFDELEKLIEAHPDPYTHISEALFWEKFNNVKATLDQPHTVLEFYKKVSSVVASIKDGHSSASLPPDWIEDMRKKKGAFPYEVYLTNQNELFLIKDYSEEGVPIPSQILEINGISVDSFLMTIDPYVSYELINFRNTIIDEDFEKYLYLAFGYSDETIFTYLNVDTLTTSVKNMPFEKWKKLQKEDRKEREKKIAVGRPYSFEKITDGVGLIHIYAFQANSINKFEIFLTNTFDDIEKDSIHSLIIDIRGNFGGWPKIASLLFHYISDTYFKTMARSEMKVSEAYRSKVYENMPHLRGKNRNFINRRHYIDIGAILHESVGNYSIEEQYFNEIPLTRNHEFKGDCYLMMNRDSYSAASSFAATFQCYQMGDIIGEVAGGTKIFRANAISERLNKSDIYARMSTTKLYTTCFSQELEGIVPNIPFVPTVLGLTSNMDTQLQYTLGVIKRKQRKKAKAATVEK